MLEYAGEQPIALNVAFRGNTTDNDGGGMNNQGELTIQVFGMCCSLVTQLGMTAVGCIISKAILKYATALLQVIWPEIAEVAFTTELGSTPSDCQ